ncbi:RidA family protein [bacterium]|nr:RidA family protein [bacterium]
MSIEARLEVLGLKLPKISKNTIGKYSPLIFMKENRLVFLSGQLSKMANGEIIAGKIMDKTNIPFGKTAARQAVLTSLSVIKTELGSIDTIRRVIRMVGYINCSSDFFEPHTILDGASELLLKLIPDEQLPARVAVGVISLPLNATIELSMVVELK